MVTGVRLKFQASQHGQNLFSTQWARAKGEEVAVPTANRKVNGKIQQSGSSEEYSVSIFGVDEMVIE